MVTYNQFQNTKNCYISRGVDVDNALVRIRREGMVNIQTDAAGKLHDPYDSNKLLSISLKQKLPIIKFEYDMLRNFKWGSTPYRGFALVLYDEGFQHKAKQLEISFYSVMYITTVMQTTSEISTIDTLSRYSFLDGRFDIHNCKFLKK
jgi:hypothetical protein